MRDSDIAELMRLLSDNDRLRNPRLSLGGVGTEDVGSIVAISA